MQKYTDRVAQKLKMKRSKNNEEKKCKSQEQAKFVINKKIIDIRAALTSTEECLPFQNNELRLFKVNNGTTFANNVIVL